MAIQNVGLQSNAAIQQMAQAQQVAKIPELETLGGALHSTASHLSAIADRMESALATFLEEPQVVQGQGERPTEPPPGTLGSLRHANTRLYDVAARIDALSIAKVLIEETD